MKRQFFSVAGAGLFMISGVLTSSASVHKAVTNTFVSAASVTFLLQGQTDCSNALQVTLTGNTTVKRGPLMLGSQVTPATIDTEMLSLELTGFHPTFGNVRLTAGAGMGLQPSMGMVIGNGGAVSNFFPGDSFFDVFFEIQANSLTSALFLSNAQPLRVQTHITKIPPISSTFTNVGTTQVAGFLTVGQQTQPIQATVIQVWHHPSQPGKETKCAVSLDVTNGFMTPGKATMTVCTNTYSAVYKIVRQELSGPVTINGCDDCGYPCSLAFVATWASNIRAPDWRGLHKGTWKLLCGTNVYAKGAMSGINGAGTHRLPLKAACEACNECGHFEGTLTGNVFDINTGLKIGKIQAVYAGDFLDAAGFPISCCPLPPRPPSGPFNMTIEGVEILPCP